MRTGIKGAMRSSRKVDGIECKFIVESGTGVWALTEAGPVGASYEDQKGVRDRTKVTSSEPGRSWFVWSQHLRLLAHA